MKILIYIFFLLIFHGCKSQVDVKLFSHAVTKNIATQLKFSAEPNGGNTMTAWSQQPKVIILNSYGEKVITGVDAFALINLTITNGTGNIVGTSSAYAILGEVYFTDLKIDLSGNKKITATKVDTTPVGGSPSISVESNTFTITALAASKVQLVSTTQIIAPGTCQNIQVKLTDNGGNAVNSSSTFTIIINGKMNSQLYSDPACTSILVNPVIASGQSTVNFYVKNFGQESVHLIANPILPGINYSTLDLKFTKPHINKLFMDNNDYVLCRIISDGTAFCDPTSLFYNPNNLQLGYSNLLDPKAISFNSKITDMALSTYSTCALLEDGSIHCWGAAVRGILGNGVSGVGNAISPSAATLVGLPGPATEIVAMINSMCALVTVATVSQVYCWGDNSLKQLADGTIIDKLTPVLASLGLSAGQSVIKIKSSNTFGDEMFAILNDGTVIHWGRGLGPATIAGLTNVIDIVSTTNVQYCALHANLTISCWGTSFNGRLPLGPMANGTIVASPTLVAGISSVQSIYLTQLGGTAQKTDGSIYVWGQQPDGTFFDIPTLKTDIAVNKIVSSNYQNCGISNIDDSQVICWGENLYPTFKTSLSSFQKISLTSPATFLDPNSCTNITSAIQNKSAPRSLLEDLILTPIDLFSVGTFYFDANCSLPANFILIAMGETSSQNLFYKNNYTALNAIETQIKVSTSDVATETGFIKFTLTGQVHHLTINGFYFDYNCMPMQLVVKDRQANTVKTPINLTSTFSGTDPTKVKLYSDPTCTTETTTLSIPAGSSSGTFYTKGVNVDCIGSMITVTTPALTNPLYSTGYAVFCGN